MRWWLLGLLALACPAAAAADRVDVVLPTLHGQYILTLDPARLSEGQARDLVVLSPHMSGWTSQAEQVLRRPYGGVEIGSDPVPVRR